MLEAWLDGVEYFLQVIKCAAAARAGDYVGLVACQASGLNNHAAYLYTFFVGEQIAFEADSVAVAVE